MLAGRDRAVQLGQGGPGGGLTFFLPGGEFHQRKFDQQALVGGLAQPSVRLGEQRHRTEQEIGRAQHGLGPVPLRERTCDFEQLQGDRIAGYQQVAHVTVKARQEGLARKTSGEHAVEGEQRSYVVAAQKCIHDTEVGVVIQHIERLGNGVVVERRTAEGNGLVEHRQRVAHSAVGFACDQVQ